MAARKGIASWQCSANPIAAAWGHLGKLYSNFPYVSPLSGSVDRLDLPFVRLRARDPHGCLEPNMAPPVTTIPEGHSAIYDHLYNRARTKSYTSSSSHLSHTGRSHDSHRTPSAHHTISHNMNAPQPPLWGMAVPTQPIQQTMGGLPFQGHVQSYPGGMQQYHPLQMLSPSQYPMSMPLQGQMLGQMHGQMQGQIPSQLSVQTPGQTAGQLPSMMPGVMSISPPVYGVTTNAPGAWKGDQEVAAMEETPPWSYGMQRFGPVSIEGCGGC